MGDTTGGDINGTPNTGDSGFDYGQGLLTLFQSGIGAYERMQIAGFESKNRYDAINGNLYKNGQVANPLLANGSMSSMMPLMLIGGLVLVAVLVMK
jgi:hypothetical protein